MKRDSREKIHAKVVDTRKVGAPQQVNFGQAVMFDRPVDVIVLDEVREASLPTGMKEFSHAARDDRATRAPALAPIAPALALTPVLALVAHALAPTFFSHFS